MIANYNLDYKTPCILLLKVPIEKSQLPLEHYYLQLLLSSNCRNPIMSFR